MNHCIRYSSSSETVFLLIKKFPPFYGTQKFTAFITVHCQTIPSAELTLNPCTYIFTVHVNIN